VERLLESILKEIDDSKKKEFSATLGDMVLANLKPFERSRLYSQKEEKDLSNNVNNINPNSNYFEELGVSEKATDKEIAMAFEEKSQQATTAAQKAEVEKAFEVLKDEESRKTYAVSGVEPTIEYALRTPRIFHVHLTKFSPTTLDEFARVTEKVDKGTELDTLIFDLRGNIGGAIDGLPYFLGPFIGADNYGYQFYHQGEKEDYVTKVGWMNSLVRYNKVVILIDENSQSTAEVMAASLKKYNVGVVVGTTSKGWGTVERVIPLDNQIAEDETFSIFLVHRITLREDGQPIEGLGVEPHISIKSSNWKNELLARYNYPEIVTVVDEILKEK
jgi:C-terminal processing protease CtpA/Prc